MFSGEGDRLLSVRLSRGGLLPITTRLNSGGGSDATGGKDDHRSLLGYHELQAMARQHVLDDGLHPPCPLKEGEVLLGLGGTSGLGYVVDAVGRLFLGRVHPSLGLNGDVNVESQYHCVIHLSRLAGSMRS